MLKKIALLLLSCVIALSVLASCDLSMLGNLQGNNGNNNDNGGNNENNENKNEEENVE